MRPGFEEAFVRELERFWHAVVEGRPACNTAAEARRDQALLIAMAQRAHESVALLVRVDY